MSLPLEGFTVVAIEQAVAAPLATRNLADLGARVIKVERIDGGDFARGYDHVVHGARPTRPKTVTSPDATDDHRHQLRPWTIRPQPACLRRHRLVPAKRPTQRPHRRNLVLANHSPKRCPIRARRSEVL